MIGVSFEGNGFERLEKTLGTIQDKFPLSKISDSIKEDLIEDTEQRGWTRGRKVVKKKVIDKNTHELSIGGDEKLKDIYSYLQTGTRPHLIPKSGGGLFNKILAFKWNGEQRFFHFVHHPGTKRTNWFSVTKAMLDKIGVIIHSFMENPK